MVKRKSFNESKHQPVTNLTYKGFSKEPAIVQVWLNQGLEQLKAGNFETASRLFEKVLEYKSDDYEVWNNQGLALTNLGRFSEALPCFEKAAELKPDYYYAWNNQAAVLFHLGRYSEALVFADKAINLQSEQHLGWLNRGLALSGLEQFTEALICFDKVIELKPDDYNALNTKGWALGKLEQYEEAIILFEKTIKINPDYPLAWNNRGLTLVYLGKYQEALKSYNKALELKPDYHEAWYNQGIALGELKRFEEAIACYDKAIKLKPDYHESWYNRGVALGKLSRFEEAIASYDKAIELKSDEHLVWNNRGVALGELKRFEEAIACYDKAIELKPDDPLVWNNQGVSLGKLEKLEEAIVCYDKAIELKPDDPLVWNNRGDALFKLGRHQEAIASFQKAIKIEADNHFAWHMQGTILNLLSQYEEALIMLKRAQELESRCASGWNELGFTLAHLGQYEEAILYYDNAIELQADEHGAWYNLGLAQTNLGRYEDAIASYDQAIKLKSEEYQIWRDRGIALYNLNQYQQALASYDKAIEIKVDDHDTWINRGLVLANLIEGRKYPESLFILPVITSYPDLSVTLNNPDLYQGGYKGLFSSYEEGLKHFLQKSEGWGKLHQAIGNAHYFRGYRNSNPAKDWRKAVNSYNEALTTLTVENFTEAYLEVLQNLIRSLLALGETDEAIEMQRRGTDVLRDLLKNTKSQAKKQQLALKFTSFHQLTADLAVQSGDLVKALEIAEKGKNACLSWLFDDRDNELPSPIWEEIKQLLNPTTAIIYWHISPVTLHTFILKYDNPSPILLGETHLPEDTEIFTQAQRLYDFDAWVKKWNQEYRNYVKAKDNQNEEDNNWRHNLPELIAELANILDISSITASIKNSTPQIKNLILIPHRDLHTLPLHALFADEFTITYLPSVQIGLSLQQIHQSSFEQPGKEKWQRLLSVEAPDSNDLEGKSFEKLPLAKIESVYISQLFPNPQRFADKAATKEDIITALKSENHIFHFTGHGTYNFYNPQKSALALTGAERLTLKDILQLNLKSYHLVSLSACETAITGNQTITTEYVGLVSGFLRQGVAHVLSTLWTVESVSSALFMIEFYRQPDRDIAPAAALKRTQMWLRSVTYSELAKWYEERATEIVAYEPICAEDLGDEAANIRKNPAKINTQVPPYAHPYYWASFIIIGNINF